MRRPTGSTPWRKRRSPTAKNPRPTPSPTAHPPTTNGSAETSDFRGGTYVRISLPPPTPHDSPELPARSHAYLTDHTRTPHIRLMFASCSPHAHPHVRS